MARLKIKDAPLLTNVIGTEKIPTGNRGDFTITPDLLIQHFINKVPFVTQSQLANVKAELETKITTVETTLNQSINALTTRVTTIESQMLGFTQDLTLHKADQNNPHNVTKQQLGLGSVDNTSDINKPLSNPTKEYVDSVVAGTDKGYLLEYYNPVKVYPRNARIMMNNASGRMVRSLINNNTNPPTDESSWRYEDLARYLIDDSGLPQQILNNGLSSPSELSQLTTPVSTTIRVSSTNADYNYVPAPPPPQEGEEPIPDPLPPENGVTVVGRWEMVLQDYYYASWFAKADGTDQRDNLAIGYAYATLKNRPFVIDDTFHFFANTSLQAGIHVLSNSTLIFTPKGKIKAILASARNGYSCIKALGCENFKIINPVVEGDRLEHATGQGEWCHGIQINDSKDGLIVNARVSQTRGDGIYIGRLSESDYDYDPQNIVVIDPIIHHVGRNGVSLCSGIDCQVVRPKISYVGDSDGKLGVYPKSGIDVEPNAKSPKNATQPMIIGCVIEDAHISYCYAGLYVSCHWDDVQFEVHLKGVTRITCQSSTDNPENRPTANNSFGFWNGGNNNKGSVVVDHIVLDGTRSFIGCPFGWSTTGTLTCEIKQVDIDPTWASFEFRNSYNGFSRNTDKRLGNFTVRNIRWGANTEVRFRYEAVDKDYTFGYQFFKHPHSKGREFVVNPTTMTTYQLSPLFSNTYVLDGTSTLSTTTLFSKFQSSTIIQNQPDATIRYVNMTGDYAVRTIRMNPLIADPVWGVNINGLNVVMNGVTYTRLLSKTRGASITLQNVVGGNTKILEMVGEWQFAS